MAQFRVDSGAFETGTIRMLGHIIAGIKKEEKGKISLPEYFLHVIVFAFNWGEWRVDRQGVGLLRRQLIVTYLPAENRLVKKMNTLSSAHIAGK
jgi:hypothetical protein